MDGGTGAECPYVCLLRSIIIYENDNKQIAKRYVLHVAALELKFIERCMLSL